MRIRKTPLPGVLVLEPSVLRDDRGFFVETYHEKKFREEGLAVRFVQDNHSQSTKGTLRGLHAQYRRPQGKLVRVVEGEVFDVAVDIRRGSPTFGKWYGEILSAENFRQLYIPVDFAHGFCVLSKTAQVQYKCTEFYDPGGELTVLWNDPDIGIEWPVAEPFLSKKDAAGSWLRDLGDVLPSFPLDLTGEDRAELERRGLDEAAMLRQLALCHNPPTALELVRPATEGDGIVVLDEERDEELLELHAEAAAAGRFSKFVPASGAASRMFSALVAARRGESADDAAEAAERFFVSRFFDKRKELPFRDQLDTLLRERGTSLEKTGSAALLAAALDAGGLGLAHLPKGLVPFHYYGGAYARTPFEEHMVEAAGHVRAGNGLCQLHLTVLEAHEDPFRSYLKEVAPRLEAELDVRFEVGFSFQAPSTDTVTADPDGGPFRGGDGKLVFRPGGHGSLIENLGQLAEAGADLVYVKNIDNVVPDDRRDVVVLWKKLLGGYLCLLERQLVEIEERATAGDADWLEDARSFLVESFAMTAERVPEDEAGIRELLSRPLRVCGMVPAMGETGGGPFWVRNARSEESLQIVETSQVDRSRKDQTAILGQATHFNPVDLVCRLRDSQGQPYDLKRFVDPDAVFVARKTHEGRPVLGLEHPGLWNGAMSRWLTAFVEVPAATFAPVKTILDLLRPEHQG